MRPTLKILLDCVAERGLDIRLARGQAVLHGNPQEATPELLTAMKFFRSEILENLGIIESLPPTKVVVESDTVIAPEVPAEAIIVIADKDGNTDHRMKSQSYMWCWVDGPRWYYVRDFPVPNK